MVGTDKHKMHICQGNLGVGGRETQDDGHWGIEDAYMPRQPRSGWQRNHKMVEIERYKMHICLGNLGVGGRESPRWWALINIRCIYAKAT